MTVAQINFNSWTNPHKLAVGGTIGAVLTTTAGVAFFVAILLSPAGSITTIALYIAGSALITTGLGTAIGTAIGHRILLHINHTCAIHNQNVVTQTDQATRKADEARLSLQRTLALCQEEAEKSQGLLDLANQSILFLQNHIATLSQESQRREELSEKPKTSTPELYQLFDAQLAKLQELYSKNLASLRTEHLQQLAERDQKLREANQSKSHIEKVLVDLHLEFGTQSVKLKEIIAECATLTQSLEKKQQELERLDQKLRETERTYAEKVQTIYDDVYAMSKSHRERISLRAKHLASLSLDQLAEELKNQAKTLQRAPSSSVPK